VCSSIIAFENPSIFASLYGFQNIWSFSVFVTMLIHSWLLFTLIACWLAICEETPLKCSISFSWIKFLEYPLSQFKSSKLVQRCMNWNDLEFQVSKEHQGFQFSKWYNPMWIMSISFLNLHFWFISSIYLDLNDHVKILWCLTNKWIMDEEELLWTLSLYVIMS
jgi:hypothetical protein